MASKKKESEGIALLSMYNDEDDEMEDLEEEDEQEQQEQQEEQDDDFKYASNVDEDSKKNDDMVLSDSANDNTTGIANDNTTSQSPLAEGEAQVPVDFQRSRRRRPTIVDYGHDEAAMSPEAEEGELGSSGRVMFGVELQTAIGDFPERTPPATVQVSTPGVQATPQSSECLEPSQCDTMNYAVSESEAAEIEEEPRNVDLLDKFLPPPPKVKCVEDLQKKINKFLAFKRAGKSFNAEVRNRKDYRNPDFLLHAVRYQDIDQIGSCFSKDVFDPHGYDKSDYFDEIEADMKRQMERKEQERKRSPKVEFVSGGTQPVTVAAAQKVNLPIPGVSTVSSSGQHSASTAADSVARDGRQNKKSKWDKVDGDRRNHLPTGGQDSVSALGAHAALLSAANAGAGYTAFAQQRRREAEEKRSSERKLERRS